MIDRPGVLANHLHADIRRERGAVHEGERVPSVLHSEQQRLSVGRFGVACNRYRDLYKKVIRFFSYYVIYIGGISAYSGFLDSTFDAIFLTLLSNTLDPDLRMQCMIVDVYIYMLNVVKRNVTKIRIEKKEMFNSNIEMMLQAESQVTSEQCRAFHDKMVSSNDIKLYVNHFQDFISEVKNSMEGGNEEGN